jgi:hypothetical protein
VKTPRPKVKSRRTVAEDVAALEAAHAGAWERAPTKKEWAVILRAKKAARAELRTRLPHCQS